MEQLPVKDFGAGRGRDGYPFYAWRPNLLQNARGLRLRFLLPEHAYGSMYRNMRKRPYPYNKFVRKQDFARTIRWYKSKARTKFRNPVKYLK